MENKITKLPLHKVIQMINSEGNVIAAFKPFTRHAGQNSDAFFFNKDGQAAYALGGAFDRLGAQGNTDMVIGGGSVYTLKLPLTLGDGYCKPRIEGTTQPNGVSSQKHFYTTSGARNLKKIRFEIPDGHAGNLIIKSIKIEQSDVAVTGVSISPSTAALKPGDTIQLNGTVAPTTTPYVKFNWESDNQNVATVDANGLVTAVANGEATITGKSTNDSTKSSVCNVSVSASVVDVTDITLSAEEMTLVPGKSAALTGTVIPEDATDPSIQYVSSDPAVVAVTKPGIIRALKEGTSVITATSVSNSAISKTCTVTVTASLPVAYGVSENFDNQVLGAQPDDYEFEIPSTDGNPVATATIMKEENTENQYLFLSKTRESVPLGSQKNVKFTRKVAPIRNNFVFEQKVATISNGGGDYGNRQVLPAFFSSDGKELFRIEAAYKFIRAVYSNGAGGTSIQVLTNNNELVNSEWFNIKIEANVKNHTFSVYLFNEETPRAENLPFINDVADNMASFQYYFPGDLLGYVELDDISLTGVQSDNLYAENLTFNSGELEDITKIADVSEGIATAKFEIVNSTSLPTDLVLIAGIYDEGGRLTNTITRTEKLPIGEYEKEFEITGISNAAEVKFFVWNGFNSLKPLLNVGGLD